MTIVLFYLLAAGVLSLAIAMLWLKNVVRLLVCLMGITVGLSGIFLLLGAQAAAAAQLMVYAGGVMVLIMFGVMLTGRTLVQPETGTSDRISSLLMAAGIAAALGYTAWLMPMGYGTQPVSSYWGGSLAGAGQTLILYYGLPFEASAVLLLVALVFATAAAFAPPGNPLTRSK